MKQKAKDECKELGFTKRTEKFGDCVMQMLLVKLKYTNKN